MSATGKRTRQPRAADYAKAFDNGWERLSRAGRSNMGRLKQAMLLLIAADAPLGPEWLDHPLKGEWAGCRECHVGGGFLLIYQLDDTAGKSGAVVFARAGTHADLLRE